MLEPHPKCATCPSRVDSIFCDLSAEYIGQLDKSKVNNHYKRGQVLFYEGNPGKGIYCIFSGKVKVFKSGTDGKEVLLRVAASGDVLGYQSLFNHGGIFASAEVIEDGTICFIDHTFFINLIQRSPELALKVISRLGDEVLQTTGRIADTANKNVRQRFANLLLILQKTYGKKHPQGSIIDIRLSRSELASMVSATPETIIRLLSDFETEGYIALDGKQIIIRNDRALLDETNLEI